MAQQTAGDFNIIAASTTGSELADILNRMNAALNTAHSGSTAPTYLLNGMLWLDTTSSSEHIMNFYNSGNTAWVELYRVTTATGLIVFSAETPATTAYHLTNKTYVDNADDLNLNLTGGTLTDSLIIDKAADATVAINVMNDVGAVRLSTADTTGASALQQLSVAGVLEENWISLIRNGAVSVYHNGSVRLVTTATGVTVTGVLTATSVSGGAETWQSIGSTIFAKCAADVATGATTQASNLTTVGVSDTSTYGVTASVSPSSGTWRCTGRSYPTSDATVTTWQRIS